MNAELIMTETHISQEISDITIFPLAALAHHLLLLLSHAATKMSLHSLTFFCEALEMSNRFISVINFFYTCKSSDFIRSNHTKYSHHIASEIQNSGTRSRKTCIVSTYKFCFAFLDCEIFIQTEQPSIPTIIKTTTPISFSMANVTPLPLLRRILVSNSSVELIPKVMVQQKNVA